MHEYKPISASDKPLFDKYFESDAPETSELTFTNLFMWRDLYRPMWREHEGCLLVLLAHEQPFGLPPVGKGDKRAALDALAEDMAARDIAPQVRRVAKTFVEAHVDSARYEIIPDRDHSDYVYLTENLIRLPGNKYHRKKNHVNRFVKNYRFEYRPLDSILVKAFLDLQENWCEFKSCDEDPSLDAENHAVHEALTHVELLGFEGGAILIDGQVEAFALGELLNPDTVVIHIEKANPEIPGLYSTINQRYCQETWSTVKYVNREQDLGLEGLRKAKLSYYPDHLVEKCTLIPTRYRIPR
ncbi:MAG: phosphatidylglycerol lysyltransferase domain-containing protein [Thermodesulfobacteriota bacterium]